MIAMKNGFLIAAEGIDGAGKRTLCSFIKKFLESKNHEVMQFEYPDYSSKWGKIIDEYLHNKIELDINEQFFVYFIDILKDQDKIQKSLEKGIVVLTDRYFTSTIAFQCAKGFNYQKAVSVIKTMDVIEPDLTLFIKIPPKVALKRKFKQKKSLDRHEKDVELLDNVDAVYEKMVNEKTLSKKWIKINGNQELKKIEEDIQNILEYGYSDHNSNRTHRHNRPRSGWLKESGITDGICVISTRHTTCSIIINENERGLRTDILDMLENIVPENKSYAHNQIDNNAHSHLRAMLLGMSEIVPVEDGHLVLGTWQSIFFVELDGPRNRSVNIKILES